MNWQLGMLKIRPLKKPTYPIHPDYYSLVIKFNVLDLFKVSIFLRPVLLEEAKGIHKWRIMHTLRLYHVFFCIVQVTLT